MMKKQRRGYGQERELEHGQIELSKSNKDNSNQEKKNPTIT